MDWNREQQIPQNLAKPHRVRDLLVGSTYKITLRQGEREIHTDKENELD